MGAAFLAGLQSGVLSNTNDIKKLWKKKYMAEPRIKKSQAKSNIKKWKYIIKTVNNFY